LKRQFGVPMAVTNRNNPYERPDRSVPVSAELFSSGA
jgi:hypothetical protein